MTDLEKSARLALELRQLANKFSEGWHDGIKIDASDVMLLADAAAALEQAEPVAEPVDKPLTKSEPEVDKEQASLRDLLIAAAAMAVVAVRQGVYEGAAWVADAVLEDHLAEQAEPVVVQAEPVVDDGQEYGIDEDTGRVK